MGQEVVIRDQSGTEHVFPAGFDPKRAAAIVNQQPVATPQQVLATLHAAHGPASDTPEPPSPHGNWLVPGSMQDFRNQLAAMMESGAHPKTLEDVASLILLPTDTTRGAIANLPGVVRGAKDVPRAIADNAPGMVRGGRQALATTLDTAGSVLETPLINVFQPGAGHGGGILRRLAALIRPAANGPNLAGYDRYLPNASQYRPPVPEAPPVAPPVSAPATPPPTTASPSSLSPKQAIDAATRAAGVTLNGRETADLFTAVKSGRSAEDALRDVVSKRAATPAGAASTPPLSGAQRQASLLQAAAKAGLKFTADELLGATELIQKGLSPEQAIEFVQRVRALPDSFKSLPGAIDVERSKYFPKGGRKTPNQP